MERVPNFGVFGGGGAGRKQKKGKSTEFWGVEWPTPPKHTKIGILYLIS
jgi:hypothetical protein